MILSGVTALSLHFSPNSIALLADYVTVVEDRSIMSVNIVPSSSLPLLAITNLPWQRGLSAIVELLVLLIKSWTFSYIERLLALIYTRWPKNGTVFWYALTSSNINRFSKLFHCQNQEKICNNTITKDPTTRQLCRHSTLWNVPFLGYPVQSSYTFNKGPFLAHPVLKHNS